MAPRAMRFRAGDLGLAAGFLADGVLCLDQV
jgi:hypothetical protein